MPRMISYGDQFQVDFDTLPAASQEALIRRGFNHVMGNEAASKASNTEGYENFTDEQKASAKLTAQQALFKAITDGTLGSGRGGGPRGTKLETVLRDLAKAEVISILNSQNIKLPKKASDTIKFKNGDEFTLAQLVDRRVGNDNHADRLRKEAETKMRADERRAAKAAAEAKGAGSVEEAGL